MRNENLGFKGATAVAVTFVLLALINCHQVNNGQIRTKITTDTIVFEGTVERLGPDPGIVSGIFAAYKLARYRVDKVCEGKYDASEIVVDHLVFTGKEFDDIAVNDRVCVAVKISKEMAERYNAEGLRSPSDDIKTFYIAPDAIKKIELGGTCCDK
jgi:hypothetical protein